MKRFLVMLGTTFFCGVLSGCSTDPREDAINGVIARMRDAAVDVNSIDDEVKKAVEKHQKEKVPLDLTEAGKMAAKLEKTGEAVQDIKVKRVDQAKPADDDDKAAFASRFKGQINTAMTSLVKNKTTLNETLDKTEKLSDDAKTKVEELRTKIRKADGPFQALNRGQG
jgi:hypothetical protein